MLRRLIFIVGMHRSGTSLVTKALETLGAALGDELLPPQPDNPTGFWEHQQVVTLNEELLASVDTTWDLPTLSPFGRDDVETLSAATPRMAAILSRLTADTGPIAVKDPRMSMLLPFWLEAARRAGFEPYLVIALRHPLAVSASLYNRNALPLRLSLSLWFSYYWRILADTDVDPSKVMVVEYEALIADQLTQMERLSAFLPRGAPEQGSMSARRRETFAQSFLDPGLDHWGQLANGGNERLSEVPHLRALFDLFTDFAEQGWSSARASRFLTSVDAVEIERANYREARILWGMHLRKARQEEQNRLAASHRQALRACEETHELVRARLEEQVAAARTENERRLDDQRRELTEFAESVRRTETRQLAEQCDEYAARLERQRRDYEQELDRRDQAAKDRLYSVEKTYALRLREVSRQHAKYSGSQRLVYRARLAAMRRTTERTKDDLSATAHELEAARRRAEESLCELRTEVAALRGSWSWRLTQPLRFLESRRRQALLKRHHRRSRLKPLHAVERLDTGLWRAQGHDPQMLFGLGSPSLRPGWYRFSVRGDGLVNPLVYLDYGNGFDEVHAFSLVGDGEVRSVLIRVGQPVERVRFDPRDQAGDFRIESAAILRITWARALVAKGLYVYNRDRNLGRTPREILAEKWSILKRIGGFEALRNFHLYVDETASPPSHPTELSYQDWIRLVEPSYLAALGTFAPSDSTHAHCAIVLAVDLPTLELTLASLQRQTRAAWRALIYLDSIQPADRERLQQDPRLLVIVDRTKSPVAAIAPQAGELVTVIAPGRVLSADYFSAVESHAQRTPEISSWVLYTDSDTLESNGGRSEPRFKPDWSPDYYLEYDYIDGVISMSSEASRKLLVNPVLDPRSYCWALLFPTRIEERKVSVRHEPCPLFHRPPESSPSSDLDAARFEALETEMHALGADVVRRRDPECARISYPVPEAEPSVTIIIPTRDALDLLRSCIGSVQHQTRYSNYEILIVDNDSSEEETLHYLRSISTKSKIRVLRYHGKFNFSAINNAAVRESDSDYICFLNNDTEIKSGTWLLEMLGLVRRHGVGVVGAKLVYADGSLQHGGVVAGAGGVAGHVLRGASGTASGPFFRLATVQDYSAVSAACMLMSRQLFTELGGFNAKELCVAFNDVDLCFRVRERGLRVLWTPDVDIVHHESKSRPCDSKRVNEFAREVRYMRIRWAKWLAADPCYNCHLSLEIADYRLSDRWLRLQATTQPSDVQPSLAKSSASQIYRWESNLQRVSQIIDAPQAPRVETHELTPGLSIVILNLDKPDLICPLLEALIDAKAKWSARWGSAMQIIIGDTGSTDPMVIRFFEEHKDQLDVVTGLKYHFSSCNNYLFTRRVRHNVTLFLNNDVIFSDAAEQVAHLYQATVGHQDVAISGTRLLYPDGRLQHDGVDIFRDGEQKGLCYHPRHGAMPEAAHPELSHQDSTRMRCLAVTGACLMIRSDLFAWFGGFDEQYKVEAQDVDLCLKVIRAGYRVQLVRVGQVVHVENATRSKGEADMHDRARFVRRWSAFVGATQ